MNNAVIPIIPICKSQTEASKDSKKLIKCTCKVKCGLKCQFKKTELPWTELCKCSDECG